MNTRSLRFKLLSWYVALLMVAFALFGGFMYVAVKQFLIDNLKDTISRRIKLVAHTVTSGPEITSASLSDQIGFLYAPETSSRFVRISVGATNVLYQSDSPEDGSFNAQTVAPPPAKFDPMRVEATGHDQPLLIASMLVDSAVGPLLIEYGAPLSPVNLALNRVTLALFLGAPILIAIAAMGAFKLIGNTLSPVLRITKSAEEISLHNLDQRLPVTQSGDEVETLALALNRMISRIDQAVEQTRRFVADASHELRTPLAILRGELENVVSRNHLTAETKETLGSNLEEVERLGKIVEGLFALSHLDAGEAYHESKIFDLAKLADTTTDQMCLLAEDKNISLVSALSGAVLVKGDPARLKQVIVNLVDNAIKYTEAGGRVEVKVYVSGKEAVLEVKDNGIGIPERDLPHVFERFYRVDKARTRELGGAGLGLSIVKSICAAHQADIQVKSVEKMGTQFFVRLPLASEVKAQPYDMVAKVESAKLG
jgi:heavy metal sensor kinase